MLRRYYVDVRLREIATDADGVIDIRETRVHVATKNDKDEATALYLAAVDAMKRTS